MRFSNLHRFDPAYPLFLFAPDDNGGGGTGNGNNADPNAGGGNNPNSGGNNANKADIDAAVNARIAELTGDDPKNLRPALDQLVRRNHGLEKKIESLKANAIPDTDKANFAAFKALNLTPDELKSIVAEHGTLKAEIAQKTRGESLEKAAAAAGLNADLLKSLSGALEVEYSVSGEGEKAVATVKLRDGEKEVVKPLLDWVDEKYPHLKEVLRRNSGSGGHQLLIPPRRWFFRHVCSLFAGFSMLKRLTSLFLAHFVRRFPLFAWKFHENHTPKFDGPHAVFSLHPCSKTVSREKKLLSPGEWARVVLGAEAAFGFDGQPTVIG